MRGTILEKMVVFCVLFCCIMGTVISSHAMTTNGKVSEVNSRSTLFPIAKRTTSISLRIYSRTELIKQEIVVSSELATKLNQLLQRLEKEGLEHPFSAKTRELRQEFIDALRGSTTVSHEVIRAMKTVAPPVWAGIHPPLSISTQLPLAKTINTTNITRYLCSVGSEGVGSELPPIMLPRPRIVCLWAGFSDSSTSIISFYPIGAATITGYQVGWAIGFIGIGVGFAFPTSPSYVMYGYAVVIHMSGEHIEEFP
jgi:hypothetical protein